MKMEKIPILFTTFNRLHYTVRALPVLLENSQEMGEVFIIDNCSDGDTVEYLKSINDPIIKAKIFNKKNTGIAGAMNQFFNLVKDNYTYFAKVDNDTIVPEGWLEELLMVIESEDVDFIQAKHFFIAKGVKDWEDLLSKCESKEVLGNNLIYRSNIGGSGIIGKLSKVSQLDEESGKLDGWSIYQEENEQLKSAFYDGVTIEVLDIEDYNKLKTDDLEYHLSTGRIDVNGIPSVSILIPVIREDRVKDCIAAIKKNILLPESKYEIITEVDKDRIGCPKMLKRLVEKAKYDFVVFLGDDTIPQYGFMIRAFYAMDKLPNRWGLVGFNDGIQDGNVLATHWLASKRLLGHLENREFFYTGYIHQFCDRELTGVATHLGRYAWAKDAVLVHNHPVRDLKFEDEDYRRVYAGDNHRHDQKLYMDRSRAKGYWKLGIGFPITDVKVYTSFFASWTVMEKPDFTLLMPNAPGPMEIIRNNLVVQALRENCTHLLMMDTDQNYPSDTIPKLLSHKKDVVAVSVHRRYPPFETILYRGEIGAYHHIPDEECFSGDLIEIDATGCGCILYNTDVFLDIPYPWFNVYRMSDGKIVGEDIDFCSKMKSAGYKIYADTSIEVGHISHIEINREFYKVYKKIKGLEWRPPPEEPIEFECNVQQA